MFNFELNFNNFKIMRNIYLVCSILFIFSSVVYAQNKVFYDEDGVKVKNIDKADYYVVDSQLPDNDTIMVEQIYYKSGALKSEAKKIKKHSKSDKKNFKWEYSGEYKKWYESGKIYEIANYRKGEIDGELTFYWPNGKIKRVENFAKRSLLQGGICYDSLGNKIDYYPYEIMPQFPGGDKELFRYLSQNVRYPVDAQKNKIQGRVIVQFYVSKTGKIVDVNVIRSISPALDAEALRVIYKMPKWEPGLQDGEPVRVKYTLPINFKLQ